MAVSLVSRGLVDLKPLVTHRFKFTDALKAFQITQAGKDEQGLVSSSCAAMLSRALTLGFFPQAAIKCVIEGPE